MFTLLLIFPVCAYPNGVGSIQGVITNQGGQPISGIQVCVTEHSTNTSFMYSSFPFSYPPWMDEETRQEMEETYPSYYPYYPSFVPMYCATSQQDGGFLIDNLKEGRYILWAYDPEGTGLKPSIYGYQKDLSNELQSFDGAYGYYPLRPIYIPVRVSDGETAGPFTLAMETGGILSGRITDEVYGSAIVNAKIIAIPFDQMDLMKYERYFYADSDENGDFVFAGLAEGRYQLSVVEADGYIIIPYPPLVEDPAGTQEHVYEVQAGQVTSGCSIALQRGGVIQGQVLHHETGEPIAGVYVSICDNGSDGYGYYFYPTRTGADGTYRFSGLKGNYILMVSHSDEFLGAYYPDTRDPDLAQTIQVEAGEEVGPIDFHLAPTVCTGNVRGQVVDEVTGLPLSGMMVYYMRSDTGSIMSSESTYGDMESSEFPPPSLDFMYPVLTDEEGRFEFTILDPGMYQLDISDPENIYLHATYPRQGELVEYEGGVYQEACFEVSGCQAIDDIQISLQRSPCLEGRVLDGATPLGGVWVQAIGSAPKSSWGFYSYAYASPYSQGPSDITDTAGRFMICGLSENAFILMAEDLHDRGYSISFCGDPNVEGIPRVISVSLGDTLSGLDIPMQAGFSVNGSVFDTEGNPLAHIGIKANITQFAFQDPSQEDYWDDWSLYDVALYASTQEDGTYVLTGLREGMYTVTTTDPNSIYVSNSLSDLYISASLEGGLPDLILSRGGILSGRVTNVSGEPLAGILVQASQGSYYYGSGGYGGTGYDPTGTYPVYPYNETDYSGYYGGIYDPNYSSGYGYYDPNLSSGTGWEYDPNYYSPSSPDNTYPDPLYYPYQQDYYSSGQFQAKTKEDGTYRITGLPTGDYSLYAEDPKEIYMDAQYYSEGFPSGSISVEEGEEISGIDFCLYRGGTVAGTIRDAATGDPLSGVMVRATLDGGDEHYYSSPSDDQGRYTITKLPQGTYSLCITSYENYQPQYYSNVTDPEEATLLEVFPEQPHEDIDFSLLQGYELSGSVLDAITGEALSIKCSVKLVNEQGASVSGAYTNNVGEYRIKAIPPGAYTIKVEYCSGYYPDCYREGDDGCTTFLIYQGGTFDGFNIFLYPKASISGRIVDESNGTPLSNKYVFAIPFNIVADPNVPYYGYGYGFYAGGSSTATDSNGYYTIGNLEEGDYRILVNDPWYLYAAEYYDNVPPNQLDQAAVIHLDRSESLTGIDFGLQIGGTYSGSASSSTAGTQYLPYQSSGGYYYGSMAGVVGFGMGYSAWSGAWNVPQGQMSPTPAPDTAPPEITSEPPMEVVAGRSYFYQVQADDFGMDTTLTYSLKLKPEGMGINVKSGVVQWDPTNEDEGESTVQAAAYNASGQMALQSFRVRVLADYIPPGEVLNLRARKGDKQATLSWTPPEDTDGDLSEQVLYIDKGNGYEEGITLPKTASKYTVKDLKNGRQYAFKITTRDRLGNESEGASTEATPSTSQAYIYPVDLIKSQNPRIYNLESFAEPKFINQVMPSVFSGWQQQSFSLSNILQSNKYIIPFNQSGSYNIFSPWQNSITGLSIGNVGYPGIMNQISGLNPELYQTWWLDGDRSYFNLFR